MRLRRVPKLIDQRMAPEHTLHDGALHALAASVNQTYLTQAGLARRVHVLIDDGRDVPRRERVQIERALDWDATAPFLAACRVAAPLMYGYSTGVLDALTNVRANA